MPTKKTPAKHKQRDIADQDHQADRPAREMIDQLRNAAHTAEAKFAGMKNNRKLTAWIRLERMINK